MKDSVFDYVHIKWNKEKKQVYYIVHTEYRYFSVRYNAWVYCHVGMISDGATKAMDIDSFAWLVHDKLCNTGVFVCGKICDNWKASNVCSDVLKRDGFRFRSFTWFAATWLFGGGKARKNGMW